MRRLFACLAATVLIAVGLSCSSSAATCAVLSVPNPLTSNYTAPPGTYCPGPQATVQGTVTADLTQATIVGAGTGYLFKPAAGANFTLKVGTVSNMAGLVIGTGLTAGQRASVDIEGGQLSGVVSGFMYKSNDGGRVDVTMRGLTGTGMGAGVRTYGSVTAVGNHLTGGGNPSSGDPVGFRALDLNTTGDPVPDQTLTLTGNTVTGFVGGNADDAGGEESVSRAVVQGNTFSDAGDAELDLKVATAVVIDNTFSAATAGIYARLVAVHAGVTYSSGNTFNAPDGSQAIEATGTVYSDLDTFNLTGSALAAKAEVACTGSTGFTGPRAGNVTIRRAVGPSPLPVRAVSGTCNGVTYTATVTIL